MFVQMPLFTVRARLDLRDFCLARTETKMITFVLYYLKTSSYELLLYLFVSVYDVCMCLHGTCVGAYK